MRLRLFVSIPISMSVKLRSPPSIVAEVVDPSHAKEPAVRGVQRLGGIPSRVVLVGCEYGAAVSEARVAYGADADLLCRCYAAKVESFEGALREVQPPVEQGGRAAVVQM